jgi:predicted ArsR family transcriptional regulator
MADRSNLHEDLSRLALLDEPVRGALYAYVASKDGAVGREEAARHVGVSRALAAFHLDRLAKAGLLDAGYTRLTGKTGPGAGRPAKVYRRGARSFEISVPPRDYAFLARLMAKALSVPGDPHRALAGNARKAGREIGLEIGRRAGHRAGRARQLQTLTEVLRERGFEPRTDATGNVVLANCPFDVLSREYTALVCGANLNLFRGLSEALDDRAKVASVSPGDGGCCVRLSF